MKQVTLLSIFFIALSAFLFCCEAQNPWLGKSLFVNPDYVAEVDETIKQFPAKRSLLEKARNVSVAFWVDRMAKLPNVTRVLDLAKRQQQVVGQQVLASFVIYDLPDRDCAAAASNGEIHCEDAQCTKGLDTYKHSYIDPIVSAFRNYPNLQIVAIVEPDSLPNLATNLNVPKCQQAQQAYMEGISYALSQLAQLSNVAIYADAAHGGWLGWDANRQAFANVFLKVWQMAGNPPFRGFVTNTANYQLAGSLSNSGDPCHLASQGNQAIDEAHYVNLMSQTLASVGITNKGWMIDTSRDAAPANERQSCSNWCNIKNAGLGYRPTTDAAAITGLPQMDAFIWVKVPGESDGTSNSNSPRYDYHCTSVDSVVPAPEAGVWFPSYFVMLAENANPPL